MKYALLIYDDVSVWERMSPEEMEALYPEYAAVAELPSTTGGAQLQPAYSARSVRVRDGERIVTDGPFAETKETLGGLFFVEADSLEEVEDIAARIPSARIGGTVEIRPLVSRDEPHREATAAPPA